MHHLHSGLVQWTLIRVSWAILRGCCKTTSSKPISILVLAPDRCTVWVREGDNHPAASGLVPSRSVGVSPMSPLTTYTLRVSHHGLSADVLAL
jgi:hypothetical protein